MNHDTLLNKTSQFTRGAVRAKRFRLECAMLNGWSADTSRTIDACVQVEEALAILEAVETAGTLATQAKALQQRSPAHRFTRPRLVPRGVTAERLYVSTAQRQVQHDAHGFESVGSILPRTLQMIDHAAQSHRRAVS